MTPVSLQQRLAKEAQEVLPMGTVEMMTSLLQAHVCIKVKCSSNSIGNLKRALNEVILES